MTSKPRCRLGKHSWRTKGRADDLTFFCELCGKTRDKPPRSRMGAAEVPLLPGGHH
jgi:hypothetical protein